MKKEIDCERASRIRRAKKARVGNPLTNEQLACMCLYLFERKGIFPEAHQVRKLMYLQRHGDMEEWSSGWYVDLFYRGGTYKPAHLNVDRDYYVVFGITAAHPRWALTDDGQVRALSAIKVLEDRCHCRVVPVPEG